MSAEAQEAEEAGAGRGGGRAAGRKRPIVRAQAREMARRVLDKCEQEKLNKFFEIPLCRALDRAAFYTGLSKRLLGRIRREAAAAGGAALRSPERVRRVSRAPRRLDDAQRELLARCLEEFYLRRGAAPSCAQLLLALRERAPFPWGVRTLQRDLARCGFLWRRCSNKRRVLVERPSVLHARLAYLRLLARLRAEARHVYYVHEASLDSTLTFRKCWHKSGSRAYAAQSSSFNQLIMMHAGSETGLLKEASLVFKAGSATGDYVGQMNASNFEKWLKEKLLPFIPANSVIVMDDAPYHCAQENKPPARGSLRKTMIEWLSRNNILYKDDMMKGELYELIELNRPQNKVFRVDRLIRNHNCDVLRLPPFMCNLNPLELAWSKVGKIIKERPTPTDTSLTNLHLLTLEAVAKLTPDHWSEYFTHVRSLEEDYLRRDRVMEEAIDEFIINAGGEAEEGDSSDESECSNSSLDTDSDVD